MLCVLVRAVKEQEKLKIQKDRLVCVWSASGLCLVCVWSVSGLRLVCVWSVSGLCLVWVWSAPGLRLVSGLRLGGSASGVWSASGRVCVWCLVCVWEGLRLVSGLRLGGSASGRGTKNYLLGRRGIARGLQSSRQKHGEIIVLGWTV
jgi:hypothetical protein